MKKKSVKPHLLHISDTLQVIKDYTPNSYEEFMSDRNAQDATLMRLQDIGEQLSRIRDSFPQFYEQHSIDSWNKLIGLRNIISHGYREIEFNIIWDVVAIKLVEFAEHVKETVSQISE